MIIPPLLDTPVAHAPGCQPARGQDQPIRRYVLDSDVLQFFQRMSRRHDQRRVKGINRLIANVGGDIQHGPNRKINVVSPDHCQSVPSRDVAQFNMDVEIAFTKLGHQGWQQEISRASTWPHFVEQYVCTV